MASKDMPSNTTYFQPSDQEINDSLTKAKQLNSEIFKENHPEEYQKQQQVK